MVKKVLVSSVALATILSVVPALAAPGNSGNVVNLPDTASQKADVIFLGTAIDPTTGLVVEGYAILHPRNGHAKGGVPGKPGGGGGGSTCYAFMASGAKWKIVEPWVVNPANSEGLSDSYVFNNLAGDIQKWENAAAFNIIGAGMTTSTTLVADTISPDGVNEVYFADIDESGVIGVTIVWGIFGGRPSGRMLVEWDQVYDDVSFDWSSAGEAGKMDFENIATHELGHTLGMGHPDSSCIEETMYAYASLGETIKRTLNAGDIAGIQALY